MKFVSKLFEPSLKERFAEVDFSENILKNDSSKTDVMKDPENKITYHSEQNSLRNSREINDFPTFRKGDV